MNQQLTNNGDDRDRTGNLRLAKPALSQLSYVPEHDFVEIRSTKSEIPNKFKIRVFKSFKLFRISIFEFRISFGILPKAVGPGRFGLPTSRLSGVRSNQLSYEPWKNPTSALSCKTGQPQSVRTSVYIHSLSKEQQKNRCFCCQRFGNLQDRLSRQSKLELAGYQDMFQNLLTFHK